ncbi:MAG TPA: phosphotransferase family protein [Porticoccaceae bacterium]|nr:phosphotransferase family protein [Porticoccaceae bacterium]HCO59875.1 phosphotransferase family protein [Porticoccaceae bacterium]
MSGAIAAALIDDIVDKLGGAVRRRYGQDARVENIAVATFGASNRTLLFDLLEGRARRRLVLRQETVKSEYSPFISTEDQYRILQVVHGHGLPVPEPVFELEAGDSLDKGFVVACVEGETLPKTLLADPVFMMARKRFAAQSGEFLARLHAIDPREFSFLESIADSQDALAAQVARYEGYGNCFPGIEVGIRWLENHRPPPRQRAFLHGEYRIGNIILGPDGIASVLDWECAHLGSVAEEFGWLCMRSWRYGRIDLPVGGMGQRDELLAAYGANGGDVPDAEELRWWEIFATLRWAVINMMQIDGHMSGERRSLPFACCGRNIAMVEYDMLMAIKGDYR